MNQNALSIETQNLTRVYRRGSEEIIAVNSISLTINKGDFVSIIGPSGSGKTTTLYAFLKKIQNPEIKIKILGSVEKRARYIGISYVISIFFSVFFAMLT